MTRTQGTFWHARLVLLALFGAVAVSACTESRSAASNPRSTDRDAGMSDTGSPTPDQVCEQKAKAFEDFVADHRACSFDSECTVIGDCGPNADFVALRVDAADAGAMLQRARCVGVFDGPVYSAVCSAGSCALKLRTDACCGCPLDAGVRRDADATGDGGPSR